MGLYGIVNLGLKPEAAPQPIADRPARGRPLFDAAIQCDPGCQHLQFGEPTFQRFAAEQRRYAGRGWKKRGGWSLRAVRFRAGALERVSGLFAEEAIADAADGFDEVGGVAQFLAEGSHVDIDRTFQRIGIFSA